MGSRFRVPGSGFVLTFAVLGSVLSSVLGSVLSSGCGRTSEPTAASSPPAAAERAAWVVNEAGVGPIGIGMRGNDLQGVLDTLGTRGECVYARPLASVVTGFRGEDLIVMLVDGVVARVDVIGGSLPTEAGARVGDSEARIRQLYPGATSEPHKYTSGRYLIVAGEHNRKMVFETDGMKVTRYRSGVVPQVEWVEGCS